MAEPLSTRKGKLDVLYSAVLLIGLWGVVTVGVEYRFSIPMLLLVTALWVLGFYGVIKLLPARYSV